MAVPDRILTNSDLEKIVDTSDEWIVSRTGIRERRVLADNLACSDLAAQAGRSALIGANLDPFDLELIITATVTADYPTPSTACIVQEKLAAKRAAAFDLSAGCSGFIYAMAAADSFIRSGAFNNALVIGAETLTRVTDWQDRSTCVLFGDAAGAAVLEKGKGAGSIIDYSLHSDGRGVELLYIPAGGSVKPADHDSVDKRLHTIRMKGNDVFKFAVRAVEEVLDQLMERNGLKADDLDHLFLHQANFRIIEHIRKRLQLPVEKVPVNIDRYGNTSSATVPVAIHEEASAGRLKKGDLAAVVAFGSGLTWGGMLIRW